MKDKFLKELCVALNDLNYSDIDETIDYYEELISDKVDDGMDEDEIIRSFGSCQEIARRLVDEDSTKNISNHGEIKITRCDTVEDMNTKSFPIDDIEKIKIESCTYNYNIVGRQADEIVVEYGADNDSSFNVYEKNGTLKLKEEMSDLLNSFTDKTGTNEATIYLPIHWNKKVKIELVDGDVSVISANLDKLNIEIVTGTITIDDLTSNKLGIQLTSGDAIVNDCELKKFNFELGTGNLTSERLKADKVNIEIVNGDVQLSVLGNQDDYHISVFEQGNEYSKNDDKDKHINAEVVMGKFEYSFIND